MTIDWAHSPDRREFVRVRWESGLSASEIARQCSAAWHEEVRKNAILGCKDRSGWESRPSPIRRDGPTKPPASGVRTACLPPGGNVLPELTSLKESMPEEVPAEPIEDVEPQHIRYVRPEGAPLYRRDGSGCLALGCDAPLYSLSKPYCRKCANSFYLNPTNKRPEVRTLTGDDIDADDDDDE